MPTGSIANILERYLVVRWMADVLRQEMENTDILTENWEGEALQLPLLRDTLEREADLVGDQCDRILQYAGCLQVIEFKRTG
ncbi:hypothetical protein TFLX_04404 [Thermoflexales bacterium]|nr:hypothetical protein TFLX_04404 [Thermoflexales bacterium]